MHQVGTRWRGWGMILGVTLVLSSCASQSSAATLTPTPTGSSGGMQMLNTANWGGYIATPGNLTGVRAQWTEPQLSGPTDTLAAIFVGIGGWAATYNKSIQVGVRPWLQPDGTADHRIWYETLPAASWTLTNLSVAPGDSISASIMLAPGSSDQWQVQLSDTTSGVALQQTVTHTSARVYADYIVEDPDASANNGPPYYPLAHFSPITFTNAQACYQSGCVAIDSQPLLQVSMVQSGATVVQPGPLTNGAFTVQRGG